MSRKKTWPLILGMTMLISWGTVTAQASAHSYVLDQPSTVHIKIIRYNHLKNFQQTPEEHRRLLALLDIDEQAYQREIRHGRSLAEIAVHQDVPVKKVVKLLTKQIKSHIESDKREHRITAGQASYMKEHAKEYAEELVNSRMKQTNTPIGHHLFN